VVKPRHEIMNYFYCQCSSLSPKQVMSSQQQSAPASPARGYAAPPPHGASPHLFNLPQVVASPLPPSPLPPTLSHSSSGYGAPHVAFAGYGGQHHHGPSSHYMSPLPGSSSVSSHSKTGRQNRSKENVMLPSQHVSSMRLSCGSTLFSISARVPPLLCRNVRCSQ
jgi:hypothetical protein